MTNISNKRKLVYILLHLILGFVLFNWPFLSTYIGLVTILIATRVILSFPDQNGIFPLFFSAYIVGIEVLLRMCGSTLFWEFGKYAVIYFIILGMIRNRQKNNFYFPMILYFLLLIPSVINLPLDSINNWRQNVAFNLAGPACLTFLVSYVYKMQINKDELGNIIFFSILPILTMSIVIILKMPDIQSYEFVPYSDFNTSGGYGPNQVSTIFGFAIVGLVIGQIIKNYLTGSIIINLSCIAFFIGLGLITFSRGGLFAAIIASVLGYSYYFFRDQKKIRSLSSTIIILIVTTITWFSIVSVTEGAISKRYGFVGGEYADTFILDLTGRAQIYRIDLKIFFDNLFTGVGPGQADQLRQIYGYGNKVAAHTEFSRMLAEHGMLGLISLILLIGASLRTLLLSDSSNGKLIKIIFGILALLTMLHSAMRIAMPCFAYALQYINFRDEV